MQEEWVLIQDYPNYIISNYGEIVNESTRRVVRQSVNTQGALKVGLFSGQAQHTKSVKVLVAHGFVEGYNDIFDTPIQLDNNQMNVRADNLLWRPRWFAWKYKRQFETSYRYTYESLFVDLETGETYSTIKEIAMRNGLLMKDVETSLYTRDYIFPTWQLFERRA